jgi:type I restriction enzyme M protein
VTAFNQEWMRARRRALGLSQAELAAKVGTNQSMISQWEKGKAEPSQELVAKLTATLSVGQQSLLSQIDEEAEDQGLDEGGEDSDGEAAPEQQVTKAKRGRKPKAAQGVEARAKEDAKAQPEVERDQLFKAADLLRNNVDPSEYKHYVLGLVFLKYVADLFAMRQAELRVEMRTPGNDYYLEDLTLDDELEILGEEDAYTRAQVFWIPDEAFEAALLADHEWKVLRGAHNPGRDALSARILEELTTLRKSPNPLDSSLWTLLRDRATQSDIGNRLDNVLDAIERANDRAKSSLKGVLPKQYGGTQLSGNNLQKLINLLSEIRFDDEGATARDTLGRVYEYFLGRFASQEGKGGGEFYTPASVVRLLVEMLEPFEGQVYDPCCGSGGMFVQSAKFVAEHGGQRTDLSVFGQELNRTTWRLCKMNLAIRGIDADIGAKHDDTLHADCHKDLRFDFVLANPPFNISVWNGELLQDDPRWRYGKPPAGNANFAWIQHIVHHLKPQGVAGVVMANGSMSSQQSGEGDIRKALVEEDRVECMVALPGQLFFTTQIPACLWILSKNKGRPHRKKAVTGDRSEQILFIDARKLGAMTDRTHRELTGDDIQLIAETFHAWRGEPDAKRAYEDIAGFCKSASLEEVRKHQYVLTPGRYVGAQEQEEDLEPFEEKMKRLTAQLTAQFAQSTELEAAIRRNLKTLGFDA